MSWLTVENKLKVGDDWLSGALGVVLKDSGQGRWWTSRYSYDNAPKI